VQHRKVREKAIHLPEVHGKAILLRADPAAAAVPDTAHQGHPPVGDLPQEDRPVVVDHAVPDHRAVKAVVLRAPGAPKSQDKVMIIFTNYGDLKNEN